MTYAFTYDGEGYRNFWNGRIGRTSCVNRAAGYSFLTLRHLIAAGKPALLCVGPEGGWEAAEVHAAESAGFCVVNMGSRILRAETAAMAALAIFQFLLNGRQVQTAGRK